MANKKIILEPICAKRSVAVYFESPKIVRLKKKCGELGLNIIRDFEGILRVGLKKRACKDVNRDINNEFSLKE